MESDIMGCNGLYHQQLDLGYVQYIEMPQIETRGEMFWPCSWTRGPSYWRYFMWSKDSICFEAKRCHETCRDFPSGSLAVTSTPDDPRSENGRYGVPWPHQTSVVLKAKIAATFHEATTMLWLLWVKHGPNHLVKRSLKKCSLLWILRIP